MDVEQEGLDFDIFFRSTRLRGNRRGDGDVARGYDRHAAFERPLGFGDCRMATRMIAPSRLLTEDDGVPTLPNEALEWVGLVGFARRGLKILRRQPRDNRRRIRPTARFVRIGCLGLTS